MKIKVAITMVVATCLVILGFSFYETTRENPYALEARHYFEVVKNNPLEKGTDVRIGIINNDLEKAGVTSEYIGAFKGQLRFMLRNYQTDQIRIRFKRILEDPLKKGTDEAVYLIESDLEKLEKPLKSIGASEEKITWILHRYHMEQLRLRFDEIRKNPLEEGTDIDISNIRESLYNESIWHRIPVSLNDIGSSEKEALSIQQKYYASKILYYSEKAQKSTTEELKGFNQEMKAFYAKKHLETSERLMEL